MKKLIIFDADSIIWTVAYKFRNKKVKGMLVVALNSFIDDVIFASGANAYIGFYGSKEDGREPNFRYSIDSNYKSHRPSEPDWMTKWRPIIHEEMSEKWGFVPVEGMEADDAVAIAVEHYRDDYDTIIVATADKDLLQIPNITYYNYTKHEDMETTDLTAAKAFYLQMLIGDAADNIKGLYKIGPVKAKKALEECDTRYGLFRTAVKMYIEKEAELRKKATRSILKRVKDEIKGSDWALDKTTKQIERKIRLQSESEIAAEIEKYMPGGWKEYFCMQYNLLKLLTEAPDEFEVPEPKEYDRPEPVTEDKGDDFLFDL